MLDVALVIAFMNIYMLFSLGGNGCTLLVQAMELVLLEHFLCVIIIYGTEHVLRENPF